MKTERDWSVSYTISWGGVNQCRKWRERALLLMWHICQLIAAAIKNEGLTFIFCWADRQLHRPICFYFLSYSFILLYFLLSVVFDQWPHVLIVLFPFPHFCFPLNLVSSVTFCPSSCFHPSLLLWLQEAGQWGWILVFCLGGLCRFVASTGCIQACVCMPVQCCVQGTETCSDRWTTRGLFPIIPFPYSSI